MSSRTEEKNACSAARKSQKRPYDNRPRSGPDPAKRRTPSKAETIRVILPAEPPPLTPEAARVLLRILLKAHDRLAATATPRRRPMIRFAFYGRVSTEDQQDPESSRGWQLTRSRALIERAGRGDRRRVLRRGQVPVDPVAAPPAGNRAARRTQEPEPRVRRRRDRRAAPGVLRQPVRADVPAVRALRRPAVGARGRRADRPAQRGPRPGHVGVRRDEQGRAEPDQDPRQGRHGRPGQGRGPVPRRAPALRVPDRRRGPHPNPAKAADGKRLHRLDLDPEAAPVVRGSSPSSPPGTASTPSPRA